MMYWIIGIAVLVVLVAYVYVMRAWRTSVRANIHHMRGDKEKARKLFLKAFELKTKNAVAYLNYAVLLLKEGNHEDAGEYIETADKLNKDIVVQKSIDLTRASRHWLAGEIDTAALLIEAMCDKYEYVNPSALATLGYLYILKGEYDKAREVSERAIDDNPQTNAAWDNLGQIAYIKKEFFRAKEHFGKALEIRGDLVESLYYMGCICEEEGNAEQAREYFAKAKDAPVTAFSGVTVEQVRSKLV